jgi:Restriction alleviation protein Lar
MIRERKPCPFCGSDQVSMSFSAGMDSPEPRARFIECEECAAMGPPCEISDHGSDAAAQEAAAACWDIRATLSRESSK